MDYQWFTEVSFKNALMQQEDYHKMAAELKKPEYHILAVDNYGRKRGRNPVLLSGEGAERPIYLQSLFFCSDK